LLSIAEIAIAAADFCCLFARQTFRSAPVVACVGFNGGAPAGFSTESLCEDVDEQDISRLMSDSTINPINK